jgi:transcriptional regulator with XRE-family HTH domain
MAQAAILRTMLKKKATQTRVKLGATVRRLRQERNWSQERLAELAGLHPNYVGGIERGERNVAIDNIEKLSKAFGLSVKDLFE